jgi:hypothetical protein
MFGCADTLKLPEGWTRGLLVLAALWLAACAPGEASRHLSATYLTGSAAMTRPVATDEYLARAETAQNRFQGILRFTLADETGHIGVLKDRFGVTADPGLQVNLLPDFSFALIQHDDTILPVIRGVQRTQHPYWEYIIEPGRVWQEDADGDWSRASLPFALKEKNQNCLHNGVLTFLYKDDGSISRVAYQIGSETCQYLHINLWGIADARYVRQKLDGVGDVIAAWLEETTNRPIVRPIDELATDFPGFNPDKLVPPAASDITVYGLVVDGVHYRSTCPTRFGPYPYCDEVDLPSYSLAKSIFAGLSYMMMIKRWPEFEHLKISTLVPECSLPDGRWDDVTTRQLLNMTTGNYISADFSKDEDSAEMTPFFLAESHADKLSVSCETWPRQNPPGSQLVYHTTDHYLLGTAMNIFLRQKEGPEADIFRDLIDKHIFAPLQLSQTSRVIQRSYDEAAQPFTAYGLFFRPDDIAILAQFLNDGTNHSELFLQRDFAAAMFRDTTGLMRWHGARGEAYKLGFWGFDIAPFVPCSTETWIPFMSGYGGIILALLPNGISYYYFTDGGHGSWKDSALETNKISKLCES